jgi:hypothetical protein
MRFSALICMPFKADTKKIPWWLRPQVGSQGMPSPRTPDAARAFLSKALEYALRKNDHSESLWDRAEECRAIASMMTDPLLKADYLKLACSYLKLAESEEALRKLSSDD